MADLSSVFFNQFKEALNISEGLDESLIKDGKYGIEYSDRKEDYVPAPLLRDGFVRIGDTVLPCSSENLRVSKSSRTRSIKGLRSSGSIQIQSGHSDIYVELDFYFHGVEEIYGLSNEVLLKNDPEDVVKRFNLINPNSLAALIGQFNRAPFLPVFNKELNTIHDTYSLVLVTLQMSTVPQYPELIRCTLVCLKYDHFIHIKSMMKLQHGFIWPVFRWYWRKYFEFNESIYKLQSQMNGGVKFYISSIKQLEEKREKLKEIINNSLKGGRGSSFLGATFTEFDNRAENILTYDPNIAPVVLEERAPPDDLCLSSISVSMENTISSIYMQNYGTPAYQFLGSADKKIMLVFHATDEESVKWLIDLAQESENIAREYSSFISSGFLAVDNEIVNLAGVEHVLFDNIRVNTVPNYPGVYEIVVNMTAFNKLQSAIETLQNLKVGDIKSLEKSDRKIKAVDYIYKQHLYNKIKTRGFSKWFKEFWANDEFAGKALDDYYEQAISRYFQHGYIQMALELTSQLELYPDLGLPTFEELIEGIEKEVFADIEDKSKLVKDYAQYYTVIKNIFYKNGRYVDPDFYIDYAFLTVGDLKEPYEGSPSLPQEFFNAFGISDYNENILAVQGSESSELMQSLYDTQLHKQDLQILERITENMKRVFGDLYYKDVEYIYSAALKLGKGNRPILRTVITRADIETILSSKGAEHEPPTDALSTFESLKSEKNYPQIENIFGIEDPQKVEDKQQGAELVKTVRSGPPKEVSDIIEASWQKKKKGGWRRKEEEIYKSLMWLALYYYTDHYETRDWEKVGTGEEPSTVYSKMHPTMVQGHVDIVSSFVAGEVPNLSSKEEYGGFFSAVKESIKNMDKSGKSTPSSLDSAIHTFIYMLHYMKNKRIEEEKHKTEELTKQAEEARQLSEVVEVERDGEKTRMSKAWKVLEESINSSTQIDSDTKGKLLKWAFVNNGNSVLNSGGFISEREVSVEVKSSLYGAAKGVPMPDSEKVKVYGVFDEPSAEGDKSPFVQWGVLVTESLIKEQVSKVISRMEELKKKEGSVPSDKVVGKETLEKSKVVADIYKVDGGLKKQPLSDKSSLINDELVISAPVDPYYKTEDSTNVFASYLDMLKHDRSGRLLQAYPSYVLQLVDEGPEVCWMRVFPTFYALNCVSSIEVISDRENPADTCIIELTNAYGNISNYAASEAIANLNYDMPWWNWWKVLLPPSKISFIPGNGIVENISEIRKEMAPINRIMLAPGARIHLRMGFGSNGAMLPVVFNGTITEVDLQERATIIAQGDGVEFDKLFPSSDDPNRNLGGSFIGVEPREFIANMLSARTPHAFLGSRILEEMWEQLAKRLYAFSNGKLFSDSALGVKHFGNPMIWYLMRKPPSGDTRNKAPNVEPEEDEIKAFMGAAAGFEDFRKNEKHIAWSMAQTVVVPCAVLCLPLMAGIEIAAAIAMGHAVVSRWVPLPLGYSYGECAENVYQATTYKPNKQDSKRPYLDTGNDEVYGWINHILSLNYGFNMYVQNKRVWDAIQLTALAFPPYVAAVRPFEYRSTLFYGAPYYALRDGYIRISSRWALNPSVLGTQKDTGPEEKKVNGNKYSKIVGVPLEYTYKTFSQVHLATSSYGLCHNGIKASSEDMYTDVDMVSYLWDGKKRYPKVYHQNIDRYIYPEQRKTIAVDSGFLGAGPPGITAISNIIPDSTRELIDVLTFHALSGIQEAYSDSVGLLGAFCSGERARLTARSILRDYSKLMYGGEIITLPKPSLRPYDYVFMNDEIKSYYGMVGVRRVVQHFSHETGFVTSTTPDLVSLVKGDLVGSGWLISHLGRMATAVGYLAMRGLALKQYSKIVKSVEAGLTKLKDATKLVDGVVTKLSAGEKVGVVRGKLNELKTMIKGVWNEVAASDEIKSVIDKVKGRITRIDKYKSVIKLQMLESTLVKAALKVGTGASAVEIAGSEVLKNIAKKKASSAMAKVLLVACGLAPEVGIPSLLIWLGLEALFYVFSKSIGVSLARHIDDTDCLILMPIKYCGAPFTAGINGHKSSIIIPFTTVDISSGKRTADNTKEIRAVADNAETHVLRSSHSINNRDLCKELVASLGKSGGGGGSEAKPLATPPPAIPASDESTPSPPPVTGSGTDEPSSSTGVSEPPLSTGIANSLLLSGEGPLGHAARSDSDWGWDEEWDSKWYDDKGKYKPFPKWFLRLRKWMWEEKLAYEDPTEAMIKHGMYVCYDDNPEPETNYIRDYRIIVGDIGDTDYTPEAPHIDTSSTPSWFSRAGVSGGITRGVYGISKGGEYNSPREGRRIHKALDFLTPKGTSIKAPCNGAVYYIGRKGGYGKTVILYVDVGSESYYLLFGHLDEIFDKGSNVNKGDVLGKSGDTGASGRPHLHFEVRKVSKVGGKVSDFDSSEKIDPRNSPFKDVLPNVKSLSPGGESKADSKKSSSARRGIESVPIGNRVEVDYNSEEITVIKKEGKNWNTYTFDLVRSGDPGKKGSHGYMPEGTYTLGRVGGGLVGLPITSTGTVGINTPQLKGRTGLLFHDLKDGKMTIEKYMSKSKALPVGKGKYYTKSGIYSDGCLGMTTLDFKKFAQLVKDMKGSPVVVEGKPHTQVKTPALIGKMIRTKRTWKKESTTVATGEQKRQNAPPKSKPKLLPPVPQYNIKASGR